MLALQDAGNALSAAYFAFLSGLTYLGKKVSVYDGYAPDEAVTPYVILTGWVPRSDNTKDTFGQTGQFGLDVVTRFTGNVFSTKPATDIANLILALLKPTPTAEPVQPDGFRIWLTVAETRTLMAPSPTDKMFRKMITLTLSLTQN